MNDQEKSGRKGRWRRPAKYICTACFTGANFLLDLPLWFHDLFGLHGRKLLGNDLQRNPVDLPGLRGHPQFRKRLSRCAESRKQMTGKHVVIIGGVALGPKAACRLKRLEPGADVLIVDQDEYISYGGCGIPYFISGDISDVRELMSTSFHMQRNPQFFRDAKDIQVRTRTRALAIDRAKKVVRVRDLASGVEEDLPYDRLVIATGSTPNEPTADSGRRPAGSNSGIGPPLRDRSERQNLRRSGGQGRNRRRGGNWM